VGIKIGRQTVVIDKAALPELCQQDPITNKELTTKSYDKEPAISLGEVWLPYRYAMICIISRFYILCSVYYYRDGLVKRVVSSIYGSVCPRLEDFFMVGGSVQCFAEGRST